VKDMKDMTMQAQDIHQLATWLAATDIDFLELQGPGVDVKICRDDASTGTTAAPPVAAPAQDRHDVVRAPWPGVLLDRIPGRPTALCAPGAAVQAGGLVAMLQIGPLLLPVHATCTGWAGALLVAPGSTVGYGTALMHIDTAPSSESLAS
jgi:acetyl-CoA carboxylase biotin carboxyl carrier protein